MEMIIMVMIITGQVDQKCFPTLYSFTGSLICCAESGVLFKQR